MIDLIIRESNFSDAKRLYNLSNDENVRSNSINKNKIKWKEHLLWLKEKLKDINYKIYLFFLGEMFVGQVKFEIDSFNAIISISISKDFRGRGLSSQMLKMSINYLLEQNNKIDVITAYIKPYNIPSIKSFLKVGFIFFKEELIQNEVYNKYLFYVKDDNENKKSSDL